MAGSLERSEDYVGAARMLAGIDLESRSRHASNEYKLATYVRIAMLFLEDSDSVSAETYIKASTRCSYSRVSPRRWRSTIHHWRPALSAAGVAPGCGYG